MVCRDWGMKSARYKGLCIACRQGAFLGGEWAGNNWIFCSAFECACDVKCLKQIQR